MEGACNGRSPWYVTSFLVIAGCVVNALTLLIQNRKPKRFDKNCIRFVTCCDFVVHGITLFLMIFQAVVSYIHGQCKEDPPEASPQPLIINEEQSTCTHHNLVDLFRLINIYGIKLLSVMGSSQLWTLIILKIQPKYSVNKGKNVWKYIMLTVPAVAAVCLYGMQYGIKHLNLNWIEKDIKENLEMYLVPTLLFIALWALPTLLLLDSICFRPWQAGLISNTRYQKKLRKRHLSTREGASDKLKRQLCQSFGRKSSVVWGDETFFILSTIASTTSFLWIPLFIHVLISDNMIDFGTLLSINLSSLLRPLTMFCLSEKFRTNLLVRLWSLPRKIRPDYPGRRGTTQ